MTTEKKIIFLNSYLPRCGHNFSAAVIKVFSNHQVIHHPHSETRLSRVLNAYFSVLKDTVYRKTAKELLDRLFIQDLREKILQEKDSKFIMVKDTSFEGVKNLPEVFPEDIHILLIRDPKRVMLSLLKGMNLKKKTPKNYLKKILMPLGVYPFIYSRKLNNQILRTVPVLDRHIIIRYEDLVKRDKNILFMLKDMFESTKSLEEIKKEIDEIGVINTSFIGETGGKKIWDQKPQNKNFNPLNRKEPNLLVKLGVEMGSRKLRKKLKYI